MNFVCTQVLFFLSFYLCSHIVLRYGNYFSRGLFLTRVEGRARDPIAPLKSTTYTPHRTFVSHSSILILTPMSPRLSQQARLVDAVLPVTGSRVGDSPYVSVDGEIQRLSKGDQELLMTGVVLSVPSLLRPESEQVRVCRAGMISPALCARLGSRFRRMWRLLSRKYPRSRSFVDLRKRRLLSFDFPFFFVYSEVKFLCKLNFTGQCVLIALKSLRNAVKSSKIF